MIKNHNLESWGDANPSHGVYTLMQPTIAPLFNGRQFQDSLLTWLKDKDPSKDNYFTKYELSNEPQSRIKNNLLNAFTFCEHYKIFNALSKKLLEEYNELSDQKEIFETIQFDENIHKLL